MHYQWKDVISHAFIQCILEDPGAVSRFRTKTSWAKLDQQEFNLLINSHRSEFCWWSLRPVPTNCPLVHMYKAIFYNTTLMRMMTFGTTAGVAPFHSFRCFVRTGSLGWMVCKGNASKPYGELLFRLSEHSQYGLKHFSFKQNWHVPYLVLWPVCPAILNEMKYSPTRKYYKLFNRQHKAYENERCRVECLEIQFREQLYSGITYE